MCFVGTLAPCCSNSFPGLSHPSTGWKRVHPVNKDLEKGLGERNAKILVLLKAFSSKGGKMPSILYKPRIRVMHCYVMCLLTKFHSTAYRMPR